jgi:hypothetical protein
VLPPLIAVWHDSGSQRFRSLALTGCGKSHPWTFSTTSTAGTAEVFLGRRASHPAMLQIIHSLLIAQVVGPG